MTLDKDTSKNHLTKKPKVNFIGIEEPKSDFRAFLDAPGNQRIFFSGKFGIGKTYFLEEFFRRNNQDYDVYHLFPVGYQITSNENIIKFLRYDILTEINKKYPDYIDARENQKADYFRVLKSFIKDSDSWNSLTNFLPATLGRPIAEVISLRQKWVNIKKSKEGISTETVEKILGESETLHPLDYVLQGFIKKAKGSKKRSVLILDDFERMDPEHIFRILNVLSVHVDSQESNKFGFDHIIIVGDIDNIRSIFWHKYGRRTDFDGYFDKFYSVTPYIFDNRKATVEIVSALLGKVKHPYKEGAMKGSIEHHSGYVRLFLTHTISQAIAARAINLRSLYKPIRHDFFSLTSRSDLSHPANSPYFVDRERGQLHWLTKSLKLLEGTLTCKESLLELLKQAKLCGYYDSADSDYYNRMIIEVLLARKKRERIKMTDKEENMYQILNQEKDGAQSNSEETQEETLSGSEYHKLAYELLTEYVKLID